MARALSDIRYALRTFRKSPGFTLAVVLTLGLGIGLNSAMFSVLWSATQRPLSYPAGEQLARLWMQAPGLGAERIPLSDAEFVHFEGRMRSVRSMGAYETEGVNIRSGDRAERVTAARATAGLFKTLGGTAAIGRVFSRREDRPGPDAVVVLSHAFWNNQLGGDVSVLGDKLLVNGVPHTIIGVMPRGFHLPAEGPALYTPLSFDPAGLDPANHRLKVVARLMPGTALAAVERESIEVASGLADKYPGYFPAPSELRANGFGLQAIDLREVLLGGVDLVLFALQGAVALVLLIACVNVATLGLARAQLRRRELSLRMALGAGRWRLVRQLLTENLVLGFLGLSLGLGLAWGGLRFLRVWHVWDIPGVAGSAVNVATLAFAFLLLIATLGMSGLVPALRATRLEPNRDLREAGAGNPFGGRRSGRTLVMAEIGLAVVLLVAAGMLVRSLWNLRNVDPGFETRGIVAGRVVLPPAQYPGRADAGLLFERLLSAVEARPEADSVALANDLPFQGGGAQTAFDIAGTTADDGNGPPREAAFRVVSPAYFETLGIPLITGEGFAGRDDANSPAVAIIDETMSRRFWPGMDPVGQRIRAPGAGAEWRRIVGVVGAVHNESPGLQPVPTLYLPRAQMNYSPQLGGWRSMAVIVRGPARAPVLTRMLRHELSELDPGLPLAGAITMQEALDGAIAGRRLATLLITSFAMLALLLALVGVHGVVSFLASGRTREFGVRMALGANKRGILMLVLRQVGLIAVLGAVPGALGALALGAFMRSQLFGVSAHDPVVFLLVPLCVVAFALLACLWPARRAARIQPTEALRYE